MLSCPHALQEEGLGEVSSLLEEEDGSAERRLREVLEELVAGCTNYLSLSRAATANAGRTKLDKERQRLCQREIVSLYSVFPFSLDFFLIFYYSFFSFSSGFLFFIIDFCCDLLF